MSKVKQSSMVRVLKPERGSREVSEAGVVIGSATKRMKRVTGGVSALAGLGETGAAAHVATLQKLEETDHTHTGDRRSTVSLVVEKEAIAEVAGGASPRSVEVKYDLTTGYVNHALRRRFGSPEAAKLALQGFVQENALACMVVAAQEIPNMTGPQAVMAGAILIDKSLALEKSIADTPKTIDFGALSEMGKTLKMLREVVARPSAGGGI